MADKYSTIQQYPQLRVPQGWSGQEKQFVVQLEEIFDDIYRRYGRLRIEDMGDRFRRVFGSVDDQYAEIVIEDGGISASLYNKYSRVSGIDIEQEGVTIIGDKFVRINVNQTQDWVYSNIGFSLRVSGDSRFNKQFWIGERDQNLVELSRTSLNFNQTTFPYSWGNGYSNNIELTHTSNIFGQDNWAWHTLIWGTGVDDRGDCMPTLYANSNMAMLGDADHMFYAVHSSLYTGFTYSGDLGRLNFVPSMKDFETRIKFETDNTYLRVKKAGSSSKTVLFEGDITGGVGLTTSATDFNDITTTGNYWIALSSVSGNRPSGLSAGTVLLEVFSSSNGSLIQKFYYTYGEMYIRHKIGTTWYGWYKFTGTAV